MLRLACLQLEVRNHACYALCARRYVKCSVCLLDTTMCRSTVAECHSCLQKGDVASGRAWLQQADSAGAPGAQHVLHAASACDEALLAAAALLTCSHGDDDGGAYEVTALAQWLAAIRGAIRMACTSCFR
jgi:hypothetical protein